MLQKLLAKGVAQSEAEESKSYCCCGPPSKFLLCAQWWMRLKSVLEQCDLRMVFEQWI